MKRGDIIIVAPPSPFNKPRPALIVQAQILDEDELLTVTLITTDLTRIRAFRIPIQPTATNCLRKPSEIQIDHLQALKLPELAAGLGKTTLKQCAR